jgi:hypothetical protein
MKEELKVSDLTENEIYSYLFSIQEAVHGGKKYSTVEMILIQVFGEELSRRGTKLDIKKLYEFRAEENE